MTQLGIVMEGANSTVVTGLVKATWSVIKRKLSTPNSKRLVAYLKQSQLPVTTKPRTLISTTIYDISDKSSLPIMNHEQFQERLDFVRNTVIGFGLKVRATTHSQRLVY